jgi:outer membrane protein
MLIPLFISTLATISDSVALTLRDAIDRALTSHPSVEVARAQRDHAAAEVGEAVATRIPRLSLDLAANQFEKPMVVAPLHAFDPRNPPQFDRTLLQGGLSFSWIAYDFGSRAAYVRAERALASVADVDVTTTEARLIGETVNAYVTLLAAREMLVAQDQRLTALRAESDRVQQLLEQGKAARLEELRVDAELKRARAERIATVSMVENSEHRLADLTSLPFGTVHAATMSRVRLSDAMVADTSASRAEALFARARQANTDVRALEERVRFADAALTGIRATGLPELHLNGGYVDRGSAQGDFRAEWQLGLSMSYSIYGGGGHESSVRKAAADLRVADAQLRAARLTVNQSVSRALSSLRQAHAQVEALESAVSESEEVARIERLALDVGSGTQSDFLEAQANTLRAKAALIDARNAEITARVELARVVGELSREWITRAVEVAP